MHRQEKLYAKWNDNDKEFQKAVKSAVDSNTRSNNGIAYGVEEEYDGTENLYYS